MIEVDEEQGFILGKARYGYRISECRKKMIEVDEEQGVISLVEELRRGGSTWQKVVDHLNDNGYTTRTGKKWKKQNAYLIMTKRS